MNSSQVKWLKNVLWLVGAFALCFGVGGWIWWRDSYQEYLHAGFHWGILPLIAGVAFSLSWIVDVGVVPSALVLGSALPAIIVARVVLDCVRDPSNHNLWPFEVGAAFMFGVMTAFPAAAIGRFLRHITHRSRRM